VGCGAGFPACQFAEGRLESLPHIPLSQQHCGLTARPGSNAHQVLTMISLSGLDHGFGQTISVRAEVSKHERGCWPFDTSGRTEIKMHMAERMIIARFRVSPPSSKDHDRIDR
jgi:hypothetical protein